MVSAMEKKYIHYGFTEFDKSQFQPISNAPPFPKPNGGLWASPVDAPYGWAAWCKDENFGDCDPENSFTFALTENARVLTLRRKEDLDDLPKLHKMIFQPIWVCLDFEALKASGWDAVEVDMSGGGNALYHPLYGWDCDSIVILNPDIIVPEV